MAITLAQLRSFLAVAETGSVRRAAEDLVVSQPSVSAAVAALAQEVGAPLLERAGRGIRLSAAGDAFVPYARDALGLLEQGSRSAREAAAVERRSLRLMAVTTAGSHLLPPLLRRFGAVEPDVDVSLEVGNRATLLARLLAHDVDVGIGGRPPRDTPVAGMPFAPNRHVVIAAPDHPLAGAARIPIERLGTETWLVREPGSGTRRLVEGYLTEHEVAPRVRTIGSNEAIRAAVAAGLGIAVVPEAAVADAVVAHAVARLDVVPEPPARVWHALYLGDRARPLARTFVDFLAHEGRGA